jgi:hypothetical protein
MCRIRVRSASSIWERDRSAPFVWERFAGLELMTVDRPFSLDTPREVISARVAFWMDDFAEPSHFILITDVLATLVQLGRGESELADECRDLEQLGRRYLQFHACGCETLSP